MSDPELAPADFALTYATKLVHEDRVTVDGKCKTVGVLIKQTSFVVMVSCTTGTIDNCSLECTLCYDNAELSVCLALDS